jgi:hypothetical protein
MLEVLMTSIHISFGRTHTSRTFVYYGLLLVISGSNKLAVGLSGGMYVSVLCGKALNEGKPHVAATALQQTPKEQEIQHHANKVVLTHKCLERGRRRRIDHFVCKVRILPCINVFIEHASNSVQVQNKKAPRIGAK